MLDFDGAVFLPFVGFFGMMVLSYPVGRAGWVWLPRLVSLVLLIGMVCLTIQAFLVPKGWEGVGYLLVVVALLLPTLLGGLIGVYLGRRKRQKLTEVRDVRPH